MLNYLHQPGALHMVINGHMVEVAKSDKHYTAVVDAIKRQASEAEILDILETEKKRMQAATQILPGVELKGGQLYYLDDPIAGVLGQKMTDMLDEGFDLALMVKFLENLLKNPSMAVVENIYPFLDFGRIPLTEDGCFLVYKAVRPDFKDIHSGKFSNTLGSVLSMPRHRVDEDRNRTCSYGFHVCSFDYLPHFAHANGHVMVCKVNPADVVAIPVDYHNTKMRVCRYEVVGECADYYETHTDVLAQASVRFGDETKPFVLETDSGDDGEGYDAFEAYPSLLLAAKALEAWRDEWLDDSVAGVRLVNCVTGTVLDELTNPDASTEEVDDEDEDPLYTLRGLSNGQLTVLGTEFTSISDAVMAALTLDNADAYPVMEVLDEDGVIVRTIS